MEFEEYLNSKDSLFHFTKREIAFEDILNTGSLRFYNIGGTDDPREYKKWNFTEMSYSDIDEKEERDPTLFLKTNEEFNSVLKNQSFIGCYTTNNISEISNDSTEIKATSIKYGYERPRMWSQYGEHHKGICLVFSKNELEKIIDNEFSNCDLVFKEYVKYQNGFRIENDHITTTYNSSERQKNDLHGFVIDHIKKVHIAAYFTKDIDYQDESEYRIILIDRVEKQKYKEVKIAKALKGIILGDLFSDVYLPIIQNFKEKYRCNIRRMYYHKGNPNLIKYIKRDIDY
jgi:hypothetical protein